MKYLLTILFSLFTLLSFAVPTANAGSDQTIYLSETTSVTLTGSGTGSGLNYSWSEVSTDYMSGGTITSPTSATTTVTGLPQGTFYFLLEVTDNVDATAYDTVVIRVNYARLPAGTTQLRSIEMTNPLVYNLVNNRDDTTQMSGSSAGITTSEGDVFFDGSRSKSMFIDAFDSKFYSTVEDGYGWAANNSYARSELSYGTGYIFDTTKTYMIEWKGYYPQDFSTLGTDQTVVSPMQLHGNDENSPPFAFMLLNGHDGGNTHVGTTGVKALYFVDVYVPNNTGSNDSAFHKITDLSNMVNQTHTIRFTIKEGEVGFVKVEFDGVQKYFRNWGKVGSTLQHDYLKFASIYDYGKALVDPANTTRHRKFSLTTEGFGIYELTPITSTINNFIILYGNYKFVN